METTERMTPMVSDPVLYWGHDGRHFAAIVTGVYEPDPDDPAPNTNLVSLTVFQPWGMSLYPYNDHGPGVFGCWSWPEEVEIGKQAFQSQIASAMLQRAIAAKERDGAFREAASIPVEDSAE